MTDDDTSCVYKSPVTRQPVDDAARRPHRKHVSFTKRPCRDGHGEEGADVNSWSLTDEERRRLRGALVQSAAGFLFGPAGPIVAWVGECLLDRRDLIFNRSGAPARAFDATGRALNLSKIGRPSAARPNTLSLYTGLTSAARQLGLREGDPVTLVLLGQPYLRSASGLVVPALVGYQVELAVPPGPYTLTAFASRRDALFTEPDPFRGVAGRNVNLDARQTLALAVTPRQPATNFRGPPAGPPPAAAPPVLPRCTCPQCNPPQRW
jgi:hypothetical protein